MSDIISKNYESLIFQVRGIKVMIDFDLASLYDTETKKLKQAVKRNKDRFPPDFMFELNNDEKESLIALVPRLESLKFSRVNPIVFTEQGVAMLSSVLSNERAVKVNIEIMRSFARYRNILMENQELKEEIQKVDEKVNQVFKILLDKIDLLSPTYTDRKMIGFKKRT